MPLLPIRQRRHIHNRCCWRLLGLSLTDRASDPPGLLSKIVQIPVEANAPPLLDTTYAFPAFLSRVFLPVPEFFATFCKENPGTINKKILMSVSFLTGTRLDRVIAHRKPPRALLGKLVREFHTQDSRIVLLSGFHDTGKTTLFLNAIAYLGPQDCILITASSENTVSEIMEVISTRKRKFVFVDEATNIRDLLTHGQDFSNQNPGCRICLAGTDTLVLKNLARNVLFGKTVLLDTTWIPFPEYAKLVRDNSMASYIESGGILGNRNDTVFRRECLRRAFRLSLPFSAKYKERQNLFESFILHLQRNFFHEILSMDFLSEDISIIINNAYLRGNTDKIIDPILDKESLEKFFRENNIEGAFLQTLRQKIFREIRKAKGNTKLPDNEKSLAEICVPNLLEKLKSRVDILTEIPFSKSEIEDIGCIFQETGILSTIPVLQANGEKNRKFVFVQPFLCFELAMTFLHKLWNDKIFKTSFTVKERKILYEKFLFAIRNHVLKNIVLFHVIKNIPENIDAFTFECDAFCYDLILMDKETSHFTVFDIRNTVFSSRFQSRFLRNSFCIEQIEQIIDGGSVVRSS